MEEKQVTNEDLVREYQETGDIDVLEKLLKRNEAFLQHYIIKYFAKRGRLSAVCSEEDLLQEGRMALCHAAKKFDCSLGFKFLSYAGFWVYQYMSSFADEAKNLMLNGEHQVNAAKLQFALMNMPHDVHGEEQVKWLSKTTGITERMIKVYLPLLGSLNPVSLDRDFDGGIILDLMESSSDPEREVFAECVFYDIGIRLWNCLNERELGVLQERFGLDFSNYGSYRTPKNLQDVGKVYGVTRERIRQIEAKALRKANKALLKEYDRDVLNLFC